MKSKIKKLEKLRSEYFEKYTKMKHKHSDYFVLLGKYAGIGEALEILKPADETN